MASDRRCVQSAFIIAAAGPGSLVSAVQTPEEAWDSWHLGRLEGLPKAEVAQIIEELRLKTPWVVPLGIGKQSTKFGESFNQFKSRVINRYWNLVAELQKNPKLLIHVMTHNYVTSIIEAYLDMYGGRPEPTDSRYTLSTFEKSTQDQPAGTAMWLRGTAKGPILFDKIRLDGKSPLTEAVIWRHGETDWN